ncbi:hypothetical protein Hanom_Chr05g00412661 [Helianthus anomalus]
MKIATKLKPQGPRFKRFEFWTKVEKVTEPQGPFWQFTLCYHITMRAPGLFLLKPVRFFKKD